MRESGVTYGEKGFSLKDEEYVRAYLVTRLIKPLRYPADALELEKTYTIGRPSPTKAQIDVKVWDKRKGKPKTFMLIEAKRPDEFETYTNLIEDQLFATGNQEFANGVRYVVWYTLEFYDHSFRDKCIVIDFRKFHDYREWVEAGEPGHNLDIPAEYGVARKQLYVKGQSPLRTDVTRRELEELRRDFHDVLWGGQKMGDTDVFNNLLKMFIAKIYDEQETDEGQPYRFQVELKDGEPESSSEVIAKINRLYQDALKRYFGYTEDQVKLSVINENRFPPNKVTYVVERLEDISLIENTYEDDVLGAFFESIVRTGFKQEKGQFFTHTNIVRFVLYALELDLWAIEMINGAAPTLPFIMDPSCGSGTFLLEAIKLITDSVLHKHNGKLRRASAVRDFVESSFLPHSQNKNAHNAWARIYIYGIDDNEDLATATKVNMILHGDGNANILKADGLLDFAKYPLTRLKVINNLPNLPYKSPVNEQFDCVVSNPPFSLKEESRTLAEYGTRFAYAEYKNSENLFIERWYQLLKEGGRLGVILPDSVFDTNENLYIRMFLYRFFWIRAVVSLPQVTFQPHTPTKTSLLFATKKKFKEVEAWDTAWRKATNEYGKLRRTRVIEFVLKNDRLRNTLIDLVAKTEIEWYPSTNLLAPSTLKPELREKLAERFEGNNKAQEKFEKVALEFDTFVAEDLLGKMNSAEATSARETLTRLLRDRVPPRADSLTLAQLVEAAYDDILQAAELNYTEEAKGQSYCNVWWCFSEVTSQKPFDYEIFFAEAENIGYKRTTRHPEGIPQPNDLFQTDQDGNITIDTENPKTILDWLRSKKVFFSQVVGEGKGQAFRRGLVGAASSYKLRISPRFLDVRNAPFENILRESLTIPLRDTCVVPIHRGVQPPKPIEDEEAETAIVVGVTELKNGFVDYDSARRIPLDFYERHKREAGTKPDDILVASTGATIGKIDIFDSPISALVNNHTTIVRLDVARFNPLFILAVLRNQIFQFQVERDKSGSAQPEIYPHELGAMRIPMLPKGKQDEISERVKQIESSIAAARARLRQPTDIINDILARAFKYPLAEHLARERETEFTRHLSNFAASFRLRNSVKFHHPDYELTYRFFETVKFKRVAAYLAIPIRLGASLSPQVMDDAGGAYYVHSGAIRAGGRVNLEECHPIKYAYYESAKRRAGLREGDIVIARSGEGTIGKAALFNLTEPCIFSDFTMRVRLNTRMNPQFACYYFRSLIFQAQVEREKRGMGNMTNIFPSQVEHLLVVDTPRPKQDRLADEITAELDRLERDRAHIEERRKEIDALIEAELRAIAREQ